MDVNHGSVSGRMRVNSAEPFVLVDPLAQLPIPGDDRVSLRTFPGVEEAGFVRFDKVDADTWWFSTVLPRRYGDIGATAEGMFANGAWYPQLLVDGAPPNVEWTVELSLPEGAGGALGNRVGRDKIQWGGTADRASLAVVPRGQITSVVGKQVYLLTKGKPRKALMAELRRLLGPNDAPLPLAIVETPDRRRLGRAGFGLAYVSDRAFRTTPGLHSFHRKPIKRALMESRLTQADPFARAIGAAALTQSEADGGTRTLQKFSWNPTIHALVYSESLPFFSEIFDRVHPTDPVNDDLTDLFAPHAPGAAVVAQIGDAYGRDAVFRLASSLSGNETLDEASLQAGIPIEFIEQWRRPPVLEDYQIVDLDGIRGVARKTTPDAPDEVVQLRVDGKPIVWRTGEGPSVWRAPPGSGRLLAIDPERHLDQPRLGDALPARWLATGWIGIESVDFEQAVIVAEAVGTLRRNDDTHHLGYASLYADRDTRIGAELGYVWRFGPRLDGLRHAHRITVGIGPVLLDDRFVALPSSKRIAVQGSVGYAYDSRVDTTFPLRGSRLGVQGDFGGVPGTDARWVIGQFSAMTVGSPHPRWAVAAQFRGGLAESNLDHRLLSLGGEGGLWSVAGSPVSGDVRVVTRFEARWAPLRHASVPLLVLWGSDLHLSAGLEAGSVWKAGRPSSVVGATAGVGVVVEWFGMSPAMLGVSMGFPLHGEGVELERRPGWFLRVGQPF